MTARSINCHFFDNFTHACRKKYVSVVVFFKHCRQLGLWCAVYWLNTLSQLGKQTEDITNCLFCHKWLKISNGKDERGLGVILNILLCLGTPSAKTCLRQVRPWSVCNFVKDLTCDWEYNFLFSLQVTSNWQPSVERAKYEDVLTSWKTKPSWLLIPCLLERTCKKTNFSPRSKIWCLL